MGIICVWRVGARITAVTRSSRVKFERANEERRLWTKTDRGAVVPYEKPTIVLL